MQKSVNTRTIASKEQQEQLIDDQDQEEDEEEINQKIERLLSEREEQVLSMCVKMGSRLDLHNLALEDIDMYSVAMYLCESNTRNVTVLHLGINQIGDEGLLDVLQALQYHQSLRELYLNKNLITETGVAAVLDTILLFPQLQILSLSKCSMNDDSVAQLCMVLPQMPHLKQLFLGQNDFGDDAAMCLAVHFSTLADNEEILHKQSEQDTEYQIQQKLGIELLHLGGNKNIKDLRIFFNSLHDQSVLKILYLNDIPLDEKNLKALGRLLALNSSLEQLNLSHCEINDAGNELLWEGLRSNNTLKSIQLFGNKIGETGLETVLMTLEGENHTLTNVELARNLIEDFDKLQEMEVMLAQNKKFEQQLKVPGGGSYLMHLLSRQKTQEEDEQLTVDEAIETDTQEEDEQNKNQQNIAEDELSDDQGFPDREEDEGDEAEDRDSNEDERELDELYDSIAQQDFASHIEEEGDAEEEEEASNEQESQQEIASQQTEKKENNKNATNKKQIPVAKVRPASALQAPTTSSKGKRAGEQNTLVWEGQEEDPILRGILHGKFKQ